MTTENEYEDNSLWNRGDSRLSSHLEEEFIEIFEDLLEKQGFSRMYGRILAYIYLREVPVTQKDLEKESHFSRSSINKAVNTLQKSGYIRKRQKGEGKTIAYYIEWGPEEILLAGIRGYISYFMNLHERFTTIFARDPKIEGLPSKRFKEFIEHLPEVTEILNRALEEVSGIELVLKK
jgi:biotin operon repressor